MVEMLHPITTQRGITNTDNNLPKYVIEFRRIFPYKIHTYMQTLSAYN